MSRQLLERIGRREVETYWDSKRKTFSIRDRVLGVVVAKADVVSMCNVIFVASEAARLRCLARGQREVHAWLRGYLCDVVEVGTVLDEVVYRPHVQSGWRCEGLPVASAYRVEAFVDRELGPAVMAYEPRGVDGSFLFPPELVDCPL